MSVPLSATQFQHLVLTSMAVGASLLMVLMDRVARLHGGDSATGRLGLGIFLLLLMVLAAGMVLTL